MDNITFQIYHAVLRNISKDKYMSSTKKMFKRQNIMRLVDSLKYENATNQLEVFLYLCKELAEN